MTDTSQPAGNAPKLPRNKTAHTNQNTVYVSNSRFQKLLALPSFKDVYDRLVAGWPTADVATYIQEDRQEYLDVTRTTLISILREYTRILPPGTLLDRKFPQVMRQARKKVESGLDELAELQKLYEIQLERIKIDFETEKKINKLLSTMAPEMKEARNLLTTMAELKMDLGLTKRHLGEAEITGTLATDYDSKYGTPVAKVMDNPDSMRKVLGLAERMLRIGGGLTNAVAREVIEESKVEEESQERLAGEVTDIEVTQEDVRIEAETGVDGEDTPGEPVFSPDSPEGIIQRFLREGDPYLKAEDTGDSDADGPDTETES